MKPRYVCIPIAVMAQSTSTAAGIAYAVERDWLVAAGNPPHSICLTESGRALVDRRYHPRCAPTPYGLPQQYPKAV
jgi:hypothetical protein